MFLCRSLKERVSNGTVPTLLGNTHNFDCDCFFICRVLLFPEIQVTQLTRTLKAMLVLQLYQKRQWEVIAPDSHPHNIMLHPRLFLSC